MTDLNQALHTKATEAAVAATAKYLADHPNDWFPCGFAWVTITPARGKFVNYLKSIKAGSKSYYRGGWQLWNPSNHATQCMEAKVAGANAYAKVLMESGIKCYADSRMD